MTLLFLFSYTNTPLLTICHTVNTLPINLLKED